MPKFTYIDHKNNDEVIYSGDAESILETDAIVNEIIGGKIENFPHIGCRIDEPKWV